MRVGGKHGRHPIAGARLAQFVADDALPNIIDAVLTWYQRRAEGVRRKRIGTLLLEGENWPDFVEAIRPALGEGALENPRPPQAIETHL